MNRSSVSEAFVHEWTKSGWTFRIFFIFFCSGRGKGESRRWRAVGDRFFFLMRSPGGGASRTGGAEGPGGCLQRIWGGGVFFYFSGPKCPPRSFFGGNLGSPTLKIS